MLIYDLDKLEIKEPSPGFKVQYVHSQHMSLAYWSIEAGVVVPEHAHPNEQLMTLLEGAFELSIEDDTTVVSAHHVIVIPANLSHSGVALTQCRIIDVFHPVRRDYL